MPTLKVAFFDIGDTLGSARVDPRTFRLQSISVFPYVPGILTDLRQRDLRLGIISNTGDETSESMRRVLEDCDLFPFFEPNLLIYSSVVGMRKDSPAIFSHAAAAAGLGDPPGQCLFIGEDSLERKYADEAGFATAPHPELAASVLDGRQLCCLRISVPAEQEGSTWKTTLAELPVVPLQVAGSNGSIIYALSDTHTACRLDDLGLYVDRLGTGFDPSLADIYLMRDDRSRVSGFLEPVGQSVTTFGGAGDSRQILCSTAAGLIAALPAGCFIDDVHFFEALHGHTTKLVPDPQILEPARTARPEASAAGLLREKPDALLTGPEISILNDLTAESVSGYLDTYIGTKPTAADATKRISSRHIRHADNALAVSALVHDLEQIGGGTFQIGLHQFVHEGRRLHNVEAEIHGGDSGEVVLLAAHLDSTAAQSQGYLPERDPAPGADDDGSGTAALLAIAGVLKRLLQVKRPRRSLRLVFFNAEEQGLVGSVAYARDQAAAGTTIAAVYQMDVIGYNLNPPLSFETHAGFWPNAAVQDRSIELARVIEKVTPLVSQRLPAPQLYFSKGPLEPDVDPAEGRSDHASFHRYGYAACITSGDFFPGPNGDSPGPEPNPNYHKNTDTFIDAQYAADIARVVAAAAWVTANTSS